MKSRRKSLVFVAAASLALTGSAAAQCTVNWEPFFQTGIGNATIYTLAVDDTSPGSPLVYAGGDFATVGGNIPTTGIAKWDGSQWTALGSGIGGVQYPTVYASALFDDDGPGPDPTSLYVGGNFTTAGGVGANYIAKWDGSSWSPLGSGMDSWVRSLVVFDDDGPGPHLPALYAGGFFTNAGGAPASCIAKWNGSSWSPVGGGITGSQYLAIWTMTLFDDDGPGPNLPALIVGGSFSQAGGVTTHKIARWNGSSWSGFGTGLGNPDVGAVLSLASCDVDGAGPNPPALYAGGLFNTANGAVAEDIARWDGGTWSPLGSGVNNGVWSMSGFDDDGPGPHAAALYACGGFWLAGGLSVQGIARWDGSSWSAVGGGLGLGIAYATTVVDLDGTGAAPPRLLAGGDFATAGEMTTPTSNRLGLAAWNGTAWGAIGGGGFGGGPYGNNVYAMSVFDEDGPGPNPPAFFAGGDFVTAAGVTVNQIARWNGWNWTALGTGLGGASGKYVGVLKTLDEDGAGPLQPALYVGGSFDQAGGVPAANLAKWNGSTWTGFGAGPGGAVYDIAVYDDDGPGPHLPSLYAAGRFTVGGGTDGILRWNGSSWVQVGGGVSGGSGTYPPVWALAVFDDDGPGPHLPALYAGGDFTTAGGVSAHCIAKWDGTAWSALGSGVDLPSGQGDPVVATLGVFDEDGAGPGLSTLFVGGAFLIAGGNPAYACARWDGSSWIPADNHVVVPHSFSVLDYDGTGPGLPVLFAGGEPYPGISYWYGSTWYPLGGGVGSSIPPDETVVWKVAVFDEDDAGPNPPLLFVGGGFSSAGGIPSATLARLPTCSTPIASFCAGDGSSHACPCNNSGAAGHGCANSANGAGALLTASGDTGVTGDSVALVSSGETGNVTSVFLQGSTAVAPVLYGDGLRCIGGSLKRLYVKTASAGIVQAPLANDPRITTRSAALGDPILPGYVRQYQVYYRDSNPTFCPMPSGSTYNISNGLKIAWGP